MTGHRRKTGKPHGAVASAARRKRHFEERLAVQTEPYGQVYATLGYFRSVLLRADPRDAEPAERAMADEFTPKLLALTASLEAQTIQRRTSDDHNGA